MQITSNGQETSVTEGTSLSAFLLEQGLDPSTVVVERNGHIVPAHDFAQTSLESGDILEILHFVGGG